MKKAIIVIVIIAVIAGGLYWRYRQRADAARDTVEVSGIIECEEVRVGSREGGRVLDVKVKEGEVVKAGRVLVRLESDALDAALSEALAAESAAAAKLEQLMNGATPEEIEAAKAAASALEYRVEMLENGSTEEEIDAAEAGVAAQQQQVDLIDSGTRQEQIDAARADWEAARAQYDNLKLTYERQERLLGAGVVSQQAADNARTAMNAAGEAVAAKKALYDMAMRGPRTQEKKAARDMLAQSSAQLRLVKKGPRAEEVAIARQQLAQSDAQLRRVVKGPRSEEIAQAGAALDQSRARVRSVRARLREMVIRAPENCVVDAIDLNPGDLVAPGEEVARLVLHEDLWVRVFVPEDMLGMVRTGSGVSLFVDSFPGKAFKGTVSRVSAKAEFTPRNVQTPEGRSMQVFRVKIVIPDKSGDLRPGMTATVKLKRK